MTGAAHECAKICQFYKPANLQGGARTHAHTRKHTHTVSGQEPETRASEQHRKIALYGFTTCLVSDNKKGNTE